MPSLKMKSPQVVTLRAVRSQHSVSQDIGDNNAPTQGRARQRRPEPRKSRRAVVIEPGETPGWIFYGPAALPGAREDTKGGDEVANVCKRRRIAPPDRGQQKAPLPRSWSDKVELRMYPIRSQALRTWPPNKDGALPTIREGPRRRAPHLRVRSTVGVAGRIWIAAGS